MRQAGPMISGTLTPSLGEGTSTVFNGTAVRFCRHISQDVCPWNVKFAREVKEPSFQPRAAIAGKDARTLAREFLAMSEDDSARRSRARR